MNLRQNFSAESSFSKTDFKKSKSSAVIDTLIFDTQSNNHVLLVDDTDTCRNSAKAILERCGFKVETASNGIEAIEKVKNALFDIILMDIEMPVMDGKTAASKIRRELCPVVPIIAMTGLIVDEFSDGLDDYIRKPIEWRSALLKMSKWILRTPTSEPRL